MVSVHDNGDSIATKDAATYSNNFAQSASTRNLTIASKVQISSAFCHPLTIKFNESNNILWRQLALATIKGQGAQKYIDGVSQPTYFFESDGKRNSENQIWEQKINYQ